MRVRFKKYAAGDDQLMSLNTLIVLKTLMKVESYAQKIKTEIVVVRANRMRNATFLNE